MCHFPRSTTTTLWAVRHFLDVHFDLTLLCWPPDYMPQDSSKFVVPRLFLTVVPWPICFTDKSHIPLAKKKKNLVGATSEDKEEGQIILKERFQSQRLEAKKDIGHDERTHCRITMDTEESNSTSITSTGIKRSCVFVVASTLVTFLAVMLLVWSRLPSDKRNIVLPACNTSECDRYANLLWLSMNASLDPCDDFYNYVCASWVRKPSLPIYSILDNLHSEMLQRLINRSFSSDIPVRNQSATQKAMQLLRTCVNVTREGQTSLEPLVRLLANISAPWPYRPTGEIEEIVVEVGINWLLPSYVALYLDHQRRDSEGRPRLTLRNNPYTERWFSRGLIMRNRGQFEEFIARHVSAFGVHPRDLPAVVHSILWALSLGEGIVTSDAREGTETLPIPESLVDVLNARVSWLGTKYEPTEFFTVRNIVLYQRIFLQYLAQPQDHGDELLALGYSMGWSVVERLGRYVSKDLALLQHWGRGAEGYDYENDCFELVNSMMGLALAFPEVGEYEPSGVANRLRGMTDTIMASLLDVINGSHILDGESRKTAFAILSDMREMFFYPRQLLPEDEVDYLFRSVPDMVHGVFLDNWMDATRALRKIVAKTPTIILSFPALRFEPEYVSTTHVLYVPAGATFFPLFSDQLVPAVNYGSLGYAIGKEYAESLFWIGSPFSWLRAGARKAYTARLDCLLGTFTSHLSREDSEADAKGKMKSFWSLGAVYRAFKSDTAGRWSRIAAAPQFSDDQLFFIAMCYNLCSTINSLITADLCNAPLKNLPEFAAAFSCESGTRMNPAEKCYAW